MVDTPLALSPEDLGARLQAARKAVRMTQEDAAAALDMARTTIVAIEKGERRVIASELVQLAGLYKKPLNELLRAGGASRPLAVQLRASVPRETLESGELEPHFAEFQSLAEDYLELERLCEAPLPRRYPEEHPLGGVAPEANAESVAQNERDRLGLGDGPIHRLRDVLEREVGLRIFFLPLPSRISGMFVYDETLGGCIAANSNHPAERVRQSLAHEYAHFLTSRKQVAVDVSSRYRRVPEGERFAYAFSPAFLMPEGGLKKRYNQMKAAGGGKFSVANMVSLAHYYGVSVESLTKRLEDLRLASRGSWEKLVGQGFRVGEARTLLELVNEREHHDLLPERYVILAIEAFKAAEISEGQFARFLRVDRSEARRLVFAYESSMLAGGRSPGWIMIDRPKAGFNA